GRRGRQVEVDVAEADDEQHAAAAVRLGDRVGARLQPRRDDLLGAGGGQVLELRVGQVDDLDDVVAGLDLVEVLVGERHGDRAVRQERLGAGVGGHHFQRRVQGRQVLARDVQLQAVQGALEEVVAPRYGQRLRAGHGPAVGADVDPADA